MTEVNSTVWQLDGRLLDVLTDVGVGFERIEAGAYVVLLQGERRPSTLIWLIAGEQAVAVEVFVMHVVPGACPDPGPLHRLLLARNLRLREVHFGLDDIGDVFLTGSLPHAAVDVTTVDRLLGEVLALLEDHQQALEAAAYGDRLAIDPGLAHKARADGAGRRPAGTPQWAPRRDVRR
ncbi:MAG: YbjN domain-containing protein [Frankiales bacterium]|nr:YbjN domain-containing protein [Frankiales bacterium]